MFYIDIHLVKVDGFGWQQKMGILIFLK